MLLKMENTLEVVELYLVLLYVLLYIRVVYSSAAALCRSPQVQNLERKI